MRCPKCNNENPDDAVYCPACYAVLLKPEAVPPAGAQPEAPVTQPPLPMAEAAGPAKPPAAAKKKPAPAKRAQPLPWRQIGVVTGIAAATLLIVWSALWFFGVLGTKEGGASAAAGAAGQEAFDRAVSASRPRPGDAVALRSATLQTTGAVLEKSIPAQTLGLYAGWVFKKSLAVLADSAKECEVTVRATLSRDAAPYFEVSSAQSQADPDLLQRLRKELDGLEALHTSAKEVSFTAVFSARGGAAAAAPAKKAGLDVEAVRQACGVEIGMFCNAQQGDAASLVRCLREHSHDLLDACRKGLSLPQE